MGRERTWARKPIHLCFAILIVVSPLGCSLEGRMASRIVESKIFAPARSGKSIDEARRHLVLGQKFLAQGEYENALTENEKATSLAGNSSPADEALFLTGLIYAYPANPAKDYGKSIAYFKKLLKDYPKSALVKEAQTIIGLLQENDKHNKMIGRLNTIIEESKKVDIGIEQRRREKR